MPSVAAGLTIMRIEAGWVQSNLLVSVNRVFNPSGLTTDTTRSLLQQSVHVKVVPGKICNDHTCTVG